MDISTKAYSKAYAMLIFLFLSFNVSSQEIIRIKFKPEMVNRLNSRENTIKQKSKSGYVLTNIAELDQITNQYRGLEMKRVFRYAGKFEEKHRKYGLDQWYEIRLDKPTTKEYKNCISALSGIDGIYIAEAVKEKELTDNENPVYVQPDFVPNDPSYNQQWHYNNTGQTGGRVGADISLEEAWDIQTGSNHVIVAITDGGVDYTHEDLAGAMWVNTLEANGTSGVDDDNNGYIDDIYGYGFCDNTGNFQPDPDGHGTHVAGTIGAVNNNGIGVSGVAGGSGSGDGVRLMSCAVFGAFGSAGGFEEAYVYAADMGAVINQNSWGYTTAGNYEQSVLDAIDYFIANAGRDASGNQTGELDGGLVIFAAGNNSSSTAHYPAYYSPVLAVASTNHNDQLSWYSNYGSWVDISAPGGETNTTTNQGVLSTLPGNSYGFYQGTSMACPHASGVAALLVSEYGGMGITPQLIRDLMVNNADSIDALNPGYKGMLGAGRINAFNALAQNDSIAPDSIIDLRAVDSAETTVTLSWTATGSSNSEGHASAYDLRYAVVKIDSANFNSATRYYNTPRPKNAGNIDSCTITGLMPGTKHYFAVKALDAFGNTSSLSNIDSATTLPAPLADITPEYLESILDSGQTEIKTFTLGNSGDGVLEFTASSTGSVAVSKLNLKNNTDYIEFPTEIEKGETDYRIGHPVLTGTGDDGPDGFGYRWIDSDEPGGPIFAWKDISSTGTKIYLGDDDYKLVSLPFTFDFYDTLYSYVYISSNGFLTFNSSGAYSLSNSQLPSTNIPNELISGFWDDLYPGNGAVYYQEVNNSFIVQYDKVSSDYYTFQIILNNDGSIKLQYLSMTGYLKSSTIGIENRDGTDGLQIAFNTSYVHDSLAISITSTPAVDIINSVTPNSGTLNPGETIDISVEISSDSLMSGNYEDAVIIHSNDPLNPEIDVPVYLHVNGIAEITSNYDSVYYGQVFITDTVPISLEITNIGTDSLAIDSITSSNPVFMVPSFDSISIYKQKTIEVQVLFGPDAEIDYFDSLAIYSNDPSNPVKYIFLTGTGLEPPVISVTPDSFDVHLFTGDTLVRTLTINNSTGGSDLIYALHISNETNNELTLQRIGKFKDRGVAIGEVEDKEVTYSYNYEQTDEDGVVKPITGKNTSSLSNDLTGMNIALTAPNRNIFTAELELRGANTYYVSYSSELLDTIDVLVIDDNDIPSGSTAEINQWIKNGGCLIIDGDEDINTYNSLIYGSGIDYLSPNAVSGLTNDIGEHPVTENITEYLIQSSSLATLSLSGNANYLIRDISGNNYAAAAELGKGKILAICNESLITDNDNAIKLGVNAVNWFNSNNKWLNVDHLSGIVPAGSSADVQVKFDATGMYGGIYQKTINISSNDPINSHLNILSTLTVTGTPLISTNTDTIDFDTSFVGYDAYRSVLITNTGTDTLKIDSITNNLHVFSLADTALVLKPKESIKLDIVFNSAINNSFTDTIYIYNNTADSICKISMNAVAILPPVMIASPDTISLDLISGDIQTENITVDNTTGGSKLNLNLSHSYIRLNQGKTGPLTINSSNEPSYDVIPQRIPQKSAIDSGTAVLIIQDYSSWGLDMWSFMYENFGINSTLIYSNNIPNYDFNNFDLIITTGGQSSSYYNYISSYSAKFEDYVARGGTVQYQLATQGNNVLIVDSVEVIYGNKENYNIVTDKSHPIVDSIPSPMYGNSANHCYINKLPASAQIIATTQNTGSPTVAEYRYGTGNVIVTGMTWEYLYNYKLSSGKILYNAVAYSLGRSNIDWLKYTDTTYTVHEGTSQIIPVQINTKGMVTGDYKAHFVVSGNDPVNSSDTVVFNLHVTGYPEITSDSTINFENVFVNRAHSRILYLNNSGFDTLKIRNITCTNPDISFDKTSFNLMVGASDSVIVNYNPKTVYSNTDIITIEYNSQSGGNYTVDVQISVVEPPIISVNPEKISIQVAKDNIHTEPLTINNTGKSDLNYQINSATSISLEDVLAQLNTNYEAITDNIQGMYEFTDGTYGTSISDGGDNMYDYGNYLRTNYSSSIYYSNKSIQNSYKFGSNSRYFTAKYPGLFILAADIDNMEYFRISGTLGCYNNGKVDTSTIDMIQKGKKYRGYIKRVYDYTTPSVNHLIIVENPDDSIVHGYNTYSGSDLHEINNISNITRIYYLLWAGDNGRHYSDTEVKKIMQSFLVSSDPQGWISYSRTSGTVVSSGFEQIGININTNFLDTGTYHSQIDILSNDPVTPALSVPVDVEVIYNQAPIVSSPLGNINLTIPGDNYLINLLYTFVDPENDALTYLCSSSDTSVVNCSVGPDNHLILKPKSLGVSIVNVRCKDIFNNMVTETFIVTVRENQKPAISDNIEDTDTYITVETLNINLSEVFSDPDNTRFRYKVSVETENICTTGISDNILSIHPKSLGNSKITITAYDPAGDSISTDFMLNVLENNAPQLITEPKDTVVYVQDEYLKMNIGKLFSDSDGDKLFYTVNNSNEEIASLTVSNDVLYLYLNTIGFTVLEIGATDNKTTDCPATSFAVNVKMKTGIKTPSEGSISIYPNPSSGKFYADLTELPDEDITLSIYNSSGELITKLSAVSGINELDLAGVNNGLYILRISTDNAQIFKSLLINK